MSERIIEKFISAFSNISPEAVVFWVSMLPIVELRGGILAGYALGLPFSTNFLFALIGNIIPVPFIIMFITYILDKLKKTRLRRIVCAIENKARSKSGNIMRAAYLGLFIFVAIPCPGTGAWTGALIASLLKMDKKKSTIAIILGVVTAGLIMGLFSYGLIDYFRN